MEDNKIIIYQTEDRQTQIDVRLETVRLPLLGRARDLHPLDYAHVGRTIRSPESFLTQGFRHALRHY